MSLIRRDFNPFEEMERMMERMRSMMNALMPISWDMPRPSDVSPLAVDMTSDENSVTIRTALPGFKQDEIDISVQGNLLTISAESKAEREEKQANWHIREMRYGKFARTVSLPEDVMTDKAEATLEDGILTIKLPKQKPSPVHKIAVTVKNLLGGKKSE
ncbi:MAG: Hsp20/alpha crystallin family protein [Chloroflexi bacterium]|jgi:HSP20 family protein|nr:Hsp20/alpha crystallin family protein [Chloroflexota bacterium]